MEKHYRYLTIPLVLFLFSFLFVGYYNRFATDDFEFLNKLREYGVVGSMKWFHEHWNTRWASILLLNSMLLLTLKAGSLIWYHLISILLLFYAFYRFMKHLFGNTNQALLLSGYLCVAFFFACFSTSDVFFWINTSAMYLYGIIALLFALGEVTDKEHTVPGYLRIAGFGLFIGGAYEPLAFTCMVTCIAVLLLQVRPYDWYVGKIEINKKIIIFLSVLMLGFAISISGEGHVARSSYLPQSDFIFKIWVWVKANVKIFVFYIPEKILPVLLLSFPCFLIGKMQPLTWVTKELLGKITFAFIFLTVISLFPVAFIMSEMGPERAWTQVSLYLVIYIAYIALYAGKFLKRKLNSNYLVGIYAVLILVFMFSTGIKNVILAKQYSIAYDNRISTILDKKNQGNKNTLELDPLPPSGWLHNAEISESPGHYYNLFLKDFFKLDFEIVVHEENR